MRSFGSRFVGPLRGRRGLRRAGNGQPRRRLPEGQLEVLASYGMTPESIGCEIRSSMDTVELGEVRPGVPVFVDRNALEGADVIVPINRVKPHTDFTGEVESGLMKMIAIGLGKQRGADTSTARASTPSMSSSRRSPSSPSRE